MRRRLTHGVIVLALAVAVALSGAVRPVSAQADPVRPQVDITQIITVAKGLVDLWKSFQSGGMSIEAATRQILAAIESARTDIIAHMDRLAAAEARACATRHVIELADIERFSPDTMQAWAQNATGCVTQIDALLGVVVDKAAADVLGIALDVVGPIALIARARAGFSTTGLLAVLISGNNKVVNVLMPQCIRQSGWHPPYITRVVCVAYNGDRAEVPGWNYDDTLRLQAMRNTSWVVAKYALPLYSS
jgi:hypothetical protein